MTKPKDKAAAPAPVERPKLEEQYQTVGGRITTPGKFEGQRLYVPYYYDNYMNGCADREDGQVLGFDVYPEDRVEFPELELERRSTVTLWLQDDGSICEI
jgi:hypothetical protein